MLAASNLRGVTRIETIATWNGYVGRSGKDFARDLDRWLNRYEPHLGNLQECSRGLRYVRPVLRDRGYTLHRKPVLGVEGRSTLLIARHDVPVHASGGIVVDVPWKGPKMGIQHPGRVFPTVKAGAVPIRDVSVHLPPGQVKNRKAYAASLTALEHRADRWTVPLVLMGDWNGSHGQRGPLSPRALAKRIGARVVHDGNDARIDFALVRGFADAVYETHGRYGSDTHRLGLLHLAY